MIENDLIKWIIYILRDVIINKISLIKFIITNFFFINFKI